MFDNQPNKLAVATTSELLQENTLAKPLQQVRLATLGKTLLGLSVVAYLLALAGVLPFVLMLAYYCLLICYWAGLTVFGLFGFLFLPEYRALYGIFPTEFDGLNAFLQGLTNFMATATIPLLITAVATTIASLVFLSMDKTKKHTKEKAFGIISIVLVVAVVVVISGLEVSV